MCCKDMLSSHMTRMNFFLFDLFTDLRGSSRSSHVFIQWQRLISGALCFPRRIFRPFGPEFCLKKRGRAPRVPLLDPPLYLVSLIPALSSHSPQRRDPGVQNQPPFTRLESKICKKLGWAFNLSKGRQVRKRHSIKWTLLASEFIALQEPITCCLMKDNSTVITSLWSTLPICHCRRANPSQGTVHIINVGNFQELE